MDPSEIESRKDEVESKDETNIRNEAILKLLLDLYEIQKIMSLYTSRKYNNEKLKGVDFLNFFTKKDINKADKKLATITIIKEKFAIEVEKMSDEEFIRTNAYDIIDKIITMDVPRKIWYFVPLYSKTGRRYVMYKDDDGSLMLDITKSAFKEVSLLPFAKKIISIGQRHFGLENFVQYYKHYVIDKTCSGLNDYAEYFDINMIKTYMKNKFNLS